MPVAVQRPSVEDYLARDADADRRCESLNGEITKVVGAEPEHNQLKDNIARELGVRLTECGCRVTTSDQRVRFGAEDYVYPDVVVACQPAYDDRVRPRALLNPELIVEVTSASTAGRDHGEKLAAYTPLESLKEYWIAEPDRPLLTQFVRREDEWRLRVHDALEDTVRSEHFDLTVPMEALYALVLETQEEPAGDSSEEDSTA